MTRVPTVGGDTGAWGDILNAYLAAERSFNVKDYDALGDNSNDDTAEIQAAVTAAGVSGGVVFFPPGIYRISSLVTIPASVSVRGSGSAQNPGDAATVIRCTASGAGLSFTGDGGQHGMFFVDGSTAGSTATAVATQPFRRLEGDAESLFVGIDVRYAAQDNLWYKNAQNDTWLSCRFQNAGRHNVVLDAGCGGLTFYGCDISSAAQHNVLIQESVAEGSGYSYPTDIQFHRCRIERALGEYACIEHKQGERIAFVHCIIAHGSDTYTGGVFNQPSSSQVGTCLIDNCSFTGRSVSTGQTAIVCQSGSAHPLILRNGLYVNAITNGLDVGSGKFVDVRAVQWDIGSGVTLYKSGIDMNGLIGFRPAGVVLYGAGSAGRQTISDSTETALTFTNESQDTSGFHNSSSNTSRITIPTYLDGTYMISATVRWDEHVTGLRLLQIRLNGTTGLGGDIKNMPTSATSCQQTVTSTLPLVAGDYIEAIVYQTSGGNLDVVHTNLSPSLFLAQRMAG